MTNLGTQRIQINLFNGPSVTVGAETVRRFPTRHAEAILTLLALSPGRRLTRDEIADTLWPDEALDASRRRIREHLYQLRKTIPNGKELVQGDGNSVWLAQAPAVTVDVFQYDRLVKQAAESEDYVRKISILVEGDNVNTGQFAPALDWSKFDSLREHYAKAHVELLRALSRLFGERK